MPASPPRLPALVPRPLAYALDLRRDGAWRPARHGVPVAARGARRALGRHDQRADRDRPDPDDVPAAGEGALRGAAPRVRGPSRAGAVARPELDRRPGADVRAGGDLPARPPGVHDRADPDRPRPLHRHGAGLEPAGARRQPVRRRACRLQLDLPDPVLLRLCVVLPRGPAAAVRARGQRDRGQLLDHRAGGADLSRHPVPRRLPDPPHPDRPARRGLVRDGVPAADRPDHAGGAPVHHRRDVQPQGRRGPAAAARRAAHRRAAHASTSWSSSCSASPWAG